MINAFIIGINGKMGKILCDAAPVYGFNVSGGLDVAKTSENVFTSATDVNVPYDVIIDFSRPASLDAVIALAKRGNAPVVLATTGYTDEQTQKIAELAKTVPVFKSANMSLGIAAVTAAIKTVKAILGDSFDVEILEKHHNQKVDVPSGTALLLADAICPRENQVVNRSGKRVAGELGITSIRGGTVVGEHEIGFYGDDEIITVSHSARSRKLFAAGAYKAAEFLLSSPPAIYNMDDLIEKLNNN